MIPRRSGAPAPRPPRVGASACFPVALALLVGLAPRAAQAQEQPDTARQTPDTLAVPPDSVRADTIFYNLPELEGEVPDGWERGVWSWDHDEIMASGANTLAELVSAVPGVLTLQGGDYGTPAAITAFGLGGGGVRVILDGFDVVPLSGGVTDLDRVGLTGIRRVRLDRRGREVLVELWSWAYDDGRPYSLVEAGTGELDTNFFRGIFAEPTALGGSVAVGLERGDTQGPGRAEPGSRTGSWVRYQLHRGDAMGVGVDLRRFRTGTDVTDYASSAQRSDLAVRARARLLPGLVGEAYSGRSTYDVDDARTEYIAEGGRRSQWGLRMAYDTAGAWARAEYRGFGGDGLPARRAEASGGFSRPELGGVEAGVDREDWSGDVVTSYRVRAWTPSLRGVTLFGSHEWGSAGARMAPVAGAYPDTLPPPADTLRPFAVTERTASRVGASVAWRDVVLSGAALRVEADSLVPLGLELDRGEPVLPGGTHTGFEVWGRLPTLWDGVRLEGSLQQWEREGPYLPHQIYKGALVFHRVMKESGTFELWWTLGVRGRDPMQIHVLDAGTGQPITVPFFQSWYGRIQIRIVTMRLFIAWENFTVRRNLQDFPDRLLPATRAVYGIRWDLWN